MKNTTRYSLTMIGAATLAACQEIDLMTNDRIQSTAAGCGALSVAAYIVANDVAVALNRRDRPDLLERRRGIRISNNDARKIQIETMLREIIEIETRVGIDKSDAALLAALYLFLGGVNVRAGVAAGARSMGTMARLIVGATRGSASILSSPWATSRISGLPAAQAIYNAMMAGELTRVDGRFLPPGIGGAPAVDDSVLGEDVIGPELSMNGAKIGTKAMMDAFAGAGMPTNKLLSALIGTAAILEIVHTDALVSDHFGPYGGVNTIHLAGLSAAKTAGLPETLTIRGLSEKVNTGRFIGELALILKDIGSPTPIGMLALQESLSVFEHSIEFGGGVSCGPISASLGFLNGYAALGLLHLLHAHWDEEKAADSLQEVMKNSFLDHESACASYNTVARTAEGMFPGPISRLTLAITEGRKTHAIARRTREAIDLVIAGQSPQAISEIFDRQRLERVERAASQLASQATGKTIEIKITKLKQNARRDSALTERYLALDCDADVTVQIDGQTYEIVGLLHKAIPKAVLNKQSELLEILNLAALPVTELILSAHTIINATVPAVVCTLMTDMDAQEAAVEAERGAWISCSTPGGKNKALRAIKYAKRYISAIDG